MKRTRKFLIVIGVVIAALIIACGAYLSDYYHADTEAVEAFASTSTVQMQQDDAGNYIFMPEDPEAGMIFYPGGKVECEAYIPLMQGLADEGVLGILVEMPFNLAVFDMNAAEGIQESYQEIEKWYIGGHSLGGSMAASYLSENSDAFDGLILLGSYSTADLSASELDVLSIYGSEDSVLDSEKYNANKRNLPEHFHEVVIDGGCHAYFGIYGAQEGDGIPTVTNEEQINITVEAISSEIRE